MNTDNTGNEKNNINSSSKAPIAVILAGVTWATMAIFVKELSARGLSSMQIALVRMIVAASIMVIYLLIKDPSKLKIQLKDIWMFIGTGIISVTLFNVTYFYTAINGEASVAVVLLYTSPIFIMIMSAILFKEKITEKKILALLLTFAGCILVAGLIGSGTQLKPLILLTGILSGFFYALYTIFSRFALKKYDSLTVTAWTFIFALAGEIFIGDLPGIARCVSASPDIIPLGIGLGLIATVIPYFLYTWGLERMESGKAAILVAIEPVVGAIIGMTMYGESHNIEKIIGIVLVITAIVLLNTGGDSHENLHHRRDS